MTTIPNESFPMSGLEGLSEQKSEAHRPNFLRRVIGKVSIDLEALEKDYHHIVGHDGEIIFVPKDIIEIPKTS